MSYDNPDPDRNTEIYVMLATLAVVMFGAAKFAGLF